MKHFGSLCILLTLIHFSTQIPKYVNCPENMKIRHTCECCEITCLSATEMTGKACPVAPAPFCAPGYQIKYFEDKTKVYPDCCPYEDCV
ncbi:uncharacterized protein LOC113003010 [Solenopsis invicta]|uniref:uncharacterized protein LOC113003010 n=1 Tax=Solenopsis invicta TaxID=13686 RepID=UPI000E33FDF1|nr:uncharacterized protein LOC113003010 [Solenopsis invicta]